MEICIGYRYFLDGLILFPSGDHRDVLISGVVEAPAAVSLYNQLIVQIR